MQKTTFFFDLDETIYPHSSGLWELIGHRITTYMTDRLGFDQEHVGNLRDKYFLEYGTTLRGLQANYHIDVNDYLAFVHDVPLINYIQPIRELPAIIGKIKAKKYIFTNADANHANRVLEIMGLGYFFDGIIDVHAIAPFCKPMPESFQIAMKTVGTTDPRACVLLDDQARVTHAAKALGMYTILVGKHNPGNDADASVMELRNLEHLLDKIL